MNFNKLIAILVFLGVSYVTGQETTLSFSNPDRDSYETTTRRGRALNMVFELNNDPNDPPAYTWVPPGLTFTCKERAPGYYADPQAKCQAYHLCMPDGRRYTMLCGIGTVFNQRTFVCDHWYNYQCANVESDYQLNNDLWEDVLLPHSGYRSPKRKSRRQQEEDNEDDK